MLCEVIYNYLCHEIIHHSDELVTLVLQLKRKLFVGKINKQITLLSSQQYGFMPNKSTETAALELMDQNITAMNYQLTPINIYLDISKAFDSIDHNILASKLKYYGIQGLALNLLKNYLLGQNQYVDLDCTLLISGRFIVEFHRDL